MFSTGILVNKENIVQKQDLKLTSEGLDWAGLRMQRVGLRNLVSLEGGSRMWGGRRWVWSCSANAICHAEGVT